MRKCDFTLSLPLTISQMGETAMTEVKQCEILDENVDNKTEHDS